MLYALIQGAFLVFNWETLLAILVGSVSGVFVGAMPGLSSTLGVALLIPFTFGFNPTTAFGLLGGMYCSSIYGGSITAILINTPGTGASAATVLDGYPMTRKGQSGKALATAIWSSFFGGVFSTMVLLLIAQPLCAIALMFGPPEMFMISLFGLTIIASVSSGSLLKGILSGMVGLLIATVGLDPQVGFGRFTFGRFELYSGINLVLVLVGFFSIPEAFMIARDTRQLAAGDNFSIGKVNLTIREVISILPIWIRSSIIGTIIGIIPGVGTPVACFAAYNEARRFSKKKDLFGTGIIEGIAAPESANNAVEGGSMVPLLTLGIPGSAQTAVYLGALMIQGLMPGPTLFSPEKAPVTYSIIIGLMVANLLMLFLGLGGIKVFLKILRINKSVLVPLIITFAVVGSYALNAYVFDIFFMLLLGFAGYFLRKNGFPLAPAVIAVILGPIGEDALLQSISIFGGNLFLFFTRPICLFFMTVTVLSVVMAIRNYVRNNAHKKT
jgi:putative tricarboxylic transport membrane protein